MSHPTPERPPFATIMRALGMKPDAWQMDVFDSERQRILLNCCRQAGKSTTVAVLALVQALYKPMTKVLIISRSHRQAKELLKQIQLFHLILRDKLLGKRSVQELELTNLSRIISLPCKEETIRGYASVDLIVLDEASRVPDDLYRAVRPMLAVSKGRLICLSTPYGKRGFFWDAWAKGGDDWQRIEVQAGQVPRIEAGFLQEERRGLGESWYRQEYECSFEALEGLVYPNFARAVGSAQKAEGGEEPSGRRVGGIDFGFRNPFAAVWGVVDHDGVLWLTGEHYQRQKPLSHHVRFLPEDVEWYADPAGANERAELRRAGLAVRSGRNALREGIAAVSARLDDGTLKVIKGRCPHLLTEAGLYRYGDAVADKRAEAPVDDHNHALAALRYLVSRLDERRLFRIRGDEAAVNVEAPKPIDHGWDDEDDARWIPLHF